MSEYGNVDVTLIVPCYNTERFLDQALSSIRQNDRCRLEILVINDGSTDGSLAIMEKHAAADPRIRVIDKPNQGYGASVNRGFNEAQGTYVAILEPDDYTSAHMYDDLFETALQYGHPDIVKAAFWRVIGAGTQDEHRLPCHFHNAIYPPHQPFTIEEEPSFLRHHPSIWSALYRRNFLNERNIRMMEVPGAGWVDNPFMVETLVQADSIVYLNTPYYCYREDLAGSSSDITLSILPFERWNDQVDVLERLGVTNSGVWDAIYTRVFEPLAHAVSCGGLTNEDCLSAMRAVCERMDESRVHTLPMVVPNNKAIYYQIMDMNCPKDLRSIFLRGRRHEYVRTLFHYGPGVFIRRGTAALRRRIRHA